MHLLKTVRLATRDYCYEWQASSCFVLALAAVLGPMLILFGLKFGIISGMFAQLVENPSNREIRPITSGRYDSAWISALHKRDDTAFIVPRTRSIASLIELHSSKAARILKTEVMPSAVDDPLLASLQVAPKGLYSIILSQSAARKLQLVPGDSVQASVARRYQNKTERVHFDLILLAVVPTSAFARDAVFADLTLVEALEDFRDGHAVPALGWVGDTVSAKRYYPSFRLYARSIHDVPNLQQFLNQEGIEVRTKATEIALVLTMERNLDAVYWLIALIGSGGFLVSLGANLWANVERKRKQLSILRLVGFRSGDIISFPMVQALYTALFGVLLAMAIYQAVAGLINTQFSDQLSTGDALCRLLPIHYVVAAGLTIAAALCSAILAGIRAARVEPTEGLREI
jgi:putative ABC transport system permease protein